MRHRQATSPVTEVLGGKPICFEDRGDTRVRPWAYRRWEYSPSETPGGQRRRTRPKRDLRQPSWRRDREGRSTRQASRWRRYPPVPGSTAATPWPQPWRMKRGRAPAADGAGDLPRLRGQVAGARREPVQTARPAARTTRPQPTGCPTRRTRVWTERSHCPLATGHPIAPRVRFFSSMTPVPLVHRPRPIFWLRFLSPTSVGGVGPGPRYPQPDPTRPLNRSKGPRTIPAALPPPPGVADPTALRSANRGGVSPDRSIGPDRWSFPCRPTPPRDLPVRGRVRRLRPRITAG